MIKLPKHCIFLKDAKPYNFYVDYASYGYVIFRYVLEIIDEVERYFENYFRVKEVRFKVDKAKYYKNYSDSKFDRPRESYTQEKNGAIVKIPNTLPIAAMKNAINVIFETPGRFIEWF